MQAATTTPPVDMIVSDLDGTFLGEGAIASDENMDAMLEAHRAGIKIAFATGRGRRFIDLIGRAIEAEPYLILNNGAVIVDSRTRDVIETFPLDPGVVVPIAAELYDAIPGARFGVEHVHGWASEPDFPPSLRAVASDLAPLPELLGRHEAVKLLVACQTLTTDDLAARVMPIVGDRLTVTWSFGGQPGVLEISAPGVHKGAALARLLDDLGIDPARVAAFGDMPNDMTMLRLVGHPFAMADAHPQLREAGFPLAGRHTESGVGRTVRALLRG